MTEPVVIDESKRLISSDMVEGTKVYNRQGEKLGTVLNFMVNKRSGEVEYAVMEFGGILGIGTEYYPIPWKMLDYDEAEGGYVVDLDKDKLEGAPRHRDRQQSFTDVYGRDVYGYYGMPYPYI
jgi:sporulation protein YlmC with PRC-barrel domain